MEYPYEEKITKDWIDELINFNKSKGLYKDGATLILPEEQYVALDVIKYAMENNIEIVHKFS